jgi:flagellar basal-body rod protein FlgB
VTDFFHTIHSLHRALDYHLERQNVIASNLANVETPGFRAHELLREVEESENRLAPTRTDASHLRAGGSSGETTELIEDTTVVPGNDGNTVSLEREMSKLAANDLRYASAGRMVARQLALLRYAANDAHG